jgi:hypothetical protein
LHTQTIEENDSEEEYIKNEYWICVEAYNFHGIQRNGIVEECNYLLRWQNPKTYEIIERWCSVRDPYASGLDENNHVTTGNGKFKITIPHDSETALFYVDKRFLIDVANNTPIPYRIVKYDSISNSYAARDEGFLVISLWQDEYNVDNDRDDLMIADYVEPPEILPSVGFCRIEPIDLNTINQNTMESFTARFFDSGGNELSSSDGIVPVWELDLPSNLQGQITVTYDNDGFTINVRATRYAVIGSSFMLRVTVDDAVYGEFMAEVVITIRPFY